MRKFRSDASYERFDEYHAAAVWTEEDDSDERGKDFVGRHYSDIRVDDIESMKNAIESYDGKLYPGPTAHVLVNAAHKFREPNGVVFDIFTYGWDGATNVQEK